MAADPFLRFWLDDQRPCPDGWVSFKSSRSMIEYLSHFFDLVTAISLDHDLGPDVEDNGYKVILWLEEHCFNHKLPISRIPQIDIHSDNGPAAARMRQARNRIFERAKTFEDQTP